jgi:hypothetical protein
MSNMIERRHELRDKLAMRYQEEPVNIEPAFSYSLFNYLTINKDDAMACKIDLINSRKIYEHVPVKEPGNWIVRMLKCMAVVGASNHDSR